MKNILNFKGNLWLNVCFIYLHFNSFIKAVCKEPYYDIMTIIGSVAFGSLWVMKHYFKK